jgi:hypothetical protein
MLWWFLQAFLFIGKVMLTKVCSTCKENKTIDSFAKDASKKDKFRCQCKTCHSLNRAQHYTDNKESILKRNKEYRQLHKEELRKSRQRYIKENPEKIATLNSKYIKRDQQRNPAKYAAKEARRRFAVRQAIPSWIDNDAVDGMYELSMLFKNVGLDTHVDHIIPLRSNLVCGLHCEANLQLLPSSDNTSKGNRWWPDMW